MGGIADIKMNKEACKEIKKALQLGGTYRLVFVCLLVAGRVRLDDVVTINSVTDAIDSKDFTFTLIINKLRMKSMKRIIANSNSFGCFMAKLKKKPQDILFVEMDDNADDEDNFLMKNPPCYNACAALKSGMLKQNKLRNVLLQTRTISILKEQVSDIKTGDYKKEVQQLKVLMNEMQESSTTNVRAAKKFFRAAKTVCRAAKSYENILMLYFLTYLVYSTVLFLSSVTCNILFLILTFCKKKKK